MSMQERMDKFKGSHVFTEGEDEGLIKLGDSTEGSGSQTQEGNPTSPDASKDNFFPAARSTEDMEKYPATVTSTFLPGISHMKLGSVSNTELELFVKGTGSIFSGENSVYTVPTDPSVKPIEKLEVEDTKGRLSDIVEEVSKRLGLRIVPGSLINIPIWGNVKGYYKFNYGSEVYFAPKSFQPTIEKHTESIKKSIMSEEISVINVAENMVVEGKKIINMLLGPKEITTLCSMFVDYGPKLMDKGLQDAVPLSLVTGDYIL